MLDNTAKHSKLSIVTYTYISMKVFFTASYEGKEYLQKYYDMVLEAIESTGVEVISPELGNYKKLLRPIEMHSLKSDEQIHYEAIRRGIMWADAVIIEVSHEDFQLGHEATLAVQDKTPVLCLSINENYGKRIHNRFFFGAKYTKYNVKDIVIDFIVKNKDELLSQRFNMFLSKSQVNYLDKMSKTKGFNKSEYLRELLENDMVNGE